MIKKGIWNKEKANTSFQGEFFMFHNLNKEHLPHKNGKKKSKKMKKLENHQKQIKHREEQNQELAKVIDLKKYKLEKIKRQYEEMSLKMGFDENKAS